jgi:hypothetical protein
MMYSGGSALYADFSDEGQPEQQDLDLGAGVHVAAGEPLLSAWFARGYSKRD